MRKWLSFLVLLLLGIFLGSNAADKGKLQNPKNVILIKKNLKSTKVSSNKTPQNINNIQRVQEIKTATLEPSIKTEHNDREEPAEEHFDEQLNMLLNIADDWSEFRNELYNQYKINKNKRKGLRSLEVDYDQAISQMLDEYNSLKVTSEKNSLWKNFENIEDNLYLEMVKKILTPKKWEKFESERAHFDQWLKENYPEHSGTSKGLKW